MKKVRSILVFTMFSLNAETHNFVYKARSNMKPREVSVSEAGLLGNQRTLVGSVIKALKTQMVLEHTPDSDSDNWTLGHIKTQTVLEHTRHRSFENFHVNVVSARIAYQLLEKMNTLNLSELQGIKDLPMMF